MSYSYECNVICDICRNQCITGEPMDNSIDAQVSARRYAESEHWKLQYLLDGSDKPSSLWRCPDCAKKEGK